MRLLLCLPWTSWLGLSKATTYGAVRKFKSTSLHRYRLDIVAKQDQSAFKPGVAGLAEFKTIGAAQHPAPGLVAHQRQRDVGDRVVEKLHVRIAAGTFTRIPGDLKGAQTVEPEPAKRGQQQQEKQTYHIHSLRNPE